MESPLELGCGLSIVASFVVLPYPGLLTRPRRRFHRRLVTKALGRPRNLIVSQASPLTRRPFYPPLNHRVAINNGSISLSPLYPSPAIDLHVRTATSLHQSFLWLRPPQE